MNLGILNKHLRLLVLQSGSVTFLCSLQLVANNLLVCVKYRAKYTGMMEINLVSIDEKEIMYM